MRPADRLPRWRSAALPLLVSVALHAGVLGLGLHGPVQPRPGLKAGFIAQRSALQVTAVVLRPAQAVRALPRPATALVAVARTGSRPALALAAPPARPDDVAAPSPAVPLPEPVAPPAEEMPLSTAGGPGRDAALGDADPQVPISGRSSGWGASSPWARSSAAFAGHALAATQHAALAWQALLGQRASVEQAQVQVRGSYESLLFRAARDLHLGDVCTVTLVSGQAPVPRCHDPRDQALFDELALQHGIVPAGLPASELTLAPSLPRVDPAEPGAPAGRAVENHGQGSSGSSG